MTRKLNQSKEWAEFHKNKLSHSYPKWPNETMLKLLFGKYTANSIGVNPDWKVLDVGCGFGNNLYPFADLGCNIHGIEIDPEIAEITTELISSKGIEANISHGTNRQIPYDDDTFDLLLSVNTVHYEGQGDLVSSAFHEFSRVLRPGGILFLSTVAPGHTIFKRAKHLGNHRYEVQNYDFRDGEEFFFFDTEETLNEYLSKDFLIVETGQVTEKLMTSPLDFFVAVAHV